MHVDTYVDLYVHLHTHVHKLTHTHGKSLSLPSGLGFTLMPHFVAPSALLSGGATL